MATDADADADADGQETPAAGSNESLPTAELESELESELERTNELPSHAGPSENRPSSHDNPNDNDGDTDFWAESEGLQPSGLLNRRAMKGKYSLQNILSIGHGMHLDKAKAAAPIIEDDPVRKGVVPYHIATSLFEGFMKSFNPFICVLDPVLHTFQYVQERSSFLLTVILAVSAKAFNPALHLELHAYSEKLFIDCFARGSKSPEIIQAILLTTYWKQPDDARSWSIIGYAIRLCMELGLHKLPISDDETNPTTSKLEIRQKRNIERLWLVFFVYDRSMSLQTGKPWMIERSDFIESVNTWYKSSFATADDATLAAFVSLRIASADILEAFSPQRPAPSMAHPYRFDALLKSLTPQIDAWRKHWLRVTSEKGEERCSSFLVSFFGTHLLLLLYSFQLQASISSPIGASLVDTEAFWITYTSALEMLNLVSHPSLSPLLSFAHDSVHAMTAYAAVFLTKLLLCVNKAVRQEFEPTVITTIELAARVFAQQNTPPTFACALQATFLKNVLREYQKACRWRSVNNRLKSSARHLQSSPTAEENLPSTTKALQFPSSAAPLEYLRKDQGGNQAEDQPQRVSDSPMQAPDPMTPSSSLPIDNVNEVVPGVDDNSPMYSDLVDTMPHDWTFADNEGWTAMFMNAGFDINTSFFVPGLNGTS
ncbi:hypothetical protein A1O3_09422 [Capronia epimyces CBS 606.96]|uniref:Xylanolytic transcriptional activator regulatory domain-containing protein n=1 Tax=Capronia epimyces CBS 606.96 TaxID=1182542 RepID=W9XMR4_9EURO|nr:uncharacterized protein A1O3_09422 [Capronia epimyces CBS 606.96]EXJ78261.1 hypothetical protein A1O3_09422 [Capronia epimyces CBS 606.96]